MSVRLVLLSTFVVMTVQELVFEPCTYAPNLDVNDQKCINNPELYPDELGQVIRAPGHCVAIGNAYIPMESSSAPLPTNYNPMSVVSAKASGLRNQFTTWSPLNQQFFASDCPFLHERLVEQDQDLLCCDEPQFESLHNQLSKIQSTCESCMFDLKNTFCVQTCSPDSSLFVDVKQIQQSEGDADHATTIYRPVEIMDYYVGEDYLRDTFEFCRAADIFTFVCVKGCSSPFDLFTGLGAYKRNQLGSPFQINFKTVENVTDDIAGTSPICSCETFDTEPRDCFRPMDERQLTCQGYCGVNCAINEEERQYQQACVGIRQNSTVSFKPVAPSDEMKQQLWSFLEEGLKESNFVVFNGIYFTLVGLLVVASLVYFTRRQKEYNANRHEVASLGEELHPTIETNDTGHVYGHDDGRPQNIGPMCGDRSTDEISALDAWLGKALRRLSVWIAYHPWPVIAVGCVFIATLSSGLSYLETETEPVKLWVSESSEAFKQRDQYGKIFSPFYRTEQIIFIPKDGQKVGRVKYLKEAIRIQEKIAQLQTPYFNATYPHIKLDQICWKATGTHCTVNSATQFFQNSLIHFQIYEKMGLVLQHFETCLTSNLMMDRDSWEVIEEYFGDAVPPSMIGCPCFSNYGAPMNIHKSYFSGKMVSGAEPSAETLVDAPQLYLESSALISTTLVLNNYDTEENKMAIAWEREFIQYLEHENARQDYFELRFMAEISIQDEIASESKGDIAPITLSYALMLIYVTLGLGRFNFSTWKTWWKEARCLLGFSGVILIFCAVLSTLGLFAWFGVKVQLVILEVVPFLTLAIGVDNLFLIVHTLAHELDHQKNANYANNHVVPEGLDAKRVQTVDAVAQVMGTTLKRIGPSIVMASTIEAIAFSFGAISPMPIVMWFAVFASVAVIINCILQLTVFLAMVVLDQRHRDNIESQEAAEEIECQVEEIVASLVMTPQMSQGLGQYKRTSSPYASNNNPEEKQDLCGGNTLNPSQSLQDRVISLYAQALSIPVVQFSIVCVFLVWSSLSVLSIEHLEHGLPQQESMPSQSYMVDYFDAMNEHLAVGPPIYFIFEAGVGGNPASINFSQPDVESRFCLSKGHCRANSVPNLVQVLGERPDISRISSGRLYSWLDSLWGFASPSNPCCRINSISQEFLPPSEEDAGSSSLYIEPCLSPDVSVPPIPSAVFPSILHMFASSAAGPTCSHGGGSMYQGQFSVNHEPIGLIQPRGGRGASRKNHGQNHAPMVLRDSRLANANLTAVSYMTLSEACRTQRDFITTYQQAKASAQWLSRETNVHVWVYSVFFVFFDQYLTIVRDTWLVLSLTLGTIFLCHVLYFRRVVVPLVLLGVMVHFTVCLMGILHPLEIQLNGLSLVNLIIAAGISVEFCSHFARAFLSHVKGQEPMRLALRQVMGSVLFGITVTKVIGLSALTLADSRLFQKYYFRMYMGIVMCGVSHGLVLLPVVMDLVHARVMTSRGKDGILGRRSLPEEDNHVPAEGGSSDSSSLDD